MATSVSFLDAKRDASRVVYRAAFGNLEKAADGRGLPHVASIDQP